MDNNGLMVAAGILLMFYGVLTYMVLWLSLMVNTAVCWCFYGQYKCLMVKKKIIVVFMDNIGVNWCFMVYVGVW